MDVAKLVNKVKSLNDYIGITQDLTTKYGAQNIVLNMSVILCFKRIRSLEIEYFNKCHESGAAFRIFERILRGPSSKQWSLLGKGLVDLILYWLDAVRHHLIDHHIHWWLFLKQLLKFTQDIISKDEELMNIVTVELAESLLELATSGKTSPEQSLHILSTFNLCCAKSRREERTRVKNRLDKHFLKLSKMVAACGHFPTQCSGLECLLRFLVSRYDRTVRATVAKAWFPLTIYKQQAVVIFLQRRWRNFIQDSRDFLNAQNAGGELVSSVLCNHLNVGDITLISAMDKWGQWVDFNIGSRTLTAFLVSTEPQNMSCHWLTIACDNVTRVTLRRDTDLAICITTNSGPQLYPTSEAHFPGSSEVTIKVSPTDIDKVNKGLIGVFGDKYQYIPEASKLPYAPHEKRWLKSGYVEASMMPWRSPSSVSTTSLAQLREKLEALPPYNFDPRTAKRQSVIVPPDLSNVTELSETDEIVDSLDSTNTLVVRPLYSGLASFLEARKAFSDDNANTAKRIQSKDRKESQSDDDSRKKTSFPKREHGISSLLAVAIQAADKNLLNKSMERVPEGHELTTDDLTALLVEEALRAREDKHKVIESGNNTTETKSQEVLDSSVVIEDSPFQNIENTTNRSKKTPAFENPYEGIPKKTNDNFKSTSDESNTSVINDTPINYVNVRRGNSNQQKSTQKLETIVAAKNIMTKDKDNQAVDENDDAQDEAAVKGFFSQHARQKQQSDYISPTRAREINETSSEYDDDNPACLISDKDFNLNIEQFDHDVEVMECLTQMIDKVCSDLERHSQNLILDMSKEASTEAENIEPLQDISNIEAQKTKPGKGKKGKPAPKKQVQKIKIQGGNDKDKKTTKTKQNKLQLEPAKKTATVNGGEVSDISANKNKSLITKESKTSLGRKKRKLYSPKDNKDISDAEDDDLPLKEILEKRKSVQEFANNDSEEDQPLIQVKEKTTSRASCYIDIEKDRKIFLTRNRNTRSRCSQCPVSPNSKMRNDVFDSLKDNIEGAEKVTLVNKKSEKDLAVYNFTSESDDEDFKKKKANIQKQASNTTVGSEVSVVSRKGKRKAKKQLVSSIESSNVPAKPATRKLRPRKLKIDRDLEDERMRKTLNEDSNTSLVAEKPQTEAVQDSEPKIVVPQPEMMIEERDVKSKVTAKTEGKKPARKKDIIKSDKVERAKTPKPESRRSKTPKLDSAIDEGERTSSPLPALEVEADKPGIQDVDDSTITTNLVQKITKMYENQDAANDNNTTQNLLSENDRMESSIDLRAVLNISDEINRHCDKDDNETYLAGTSVIGKQLKNKLYSDISDAENENLVIPEKDASQSKDCISGRYTKKKTLTLKKKASIECHENFQSKVDESKKVIVEEKKERIHVTAQLADIHKSSTLKATGIEKIITIADEADVASNMTSRRHTVQQKRKKSTILLAADLSESDIEKIFLTDDESEKSIATDGITAHGDSDEQPPMAKGLKEKCVPRDLEDMDPDLREYSETLDKVFHGCKDQAKTNAAEKVDSLRSVIEKISSEETSNSSDANDHGKRWDDDIQRYLPSRRESMSSSASDTSKNRMQTRQLIKNTQNKSHIKDGIEIKEYSKSKKEIKTVNIKDINTKRKSQISPIIWLEDMPKKKVRPETSDSSPQITSPESQEITIKTVKSPDTNTYSTGITKKVPKRFEHSKTASIKRTSRTSSDSAEDATVAGTSKSKAFAPVTKNIVKESVNSEEVYATKSKRFANQKKTDFSTPTDSKTNKSVTEAQTLSPLATKKNIPSRVHHTCPTTPKHYQISSELSPASKEIIKNLYGRSLNSPESKISTSPHTPVKQVKRDTPIKRPSDFDMEVNAKRPKRVPQVVIPKLALDSGPSTASITDWLKDTELSGKATSQEDAMRDTLYNVIEKLNTTVAEIHQNSGRNFRCLFVEAEKRLTAMREERMEYTNAIQTLMSQMMEKMAEQEQSFRTWLKQRAADFLLEEMQQKQAMVNLLKEDAEAVLRHMDKGKH